jgi:hypothetical protein
MVLLYARNALLKGWWDKVTLLVWGASQVLVASDAGVKEALAAAMEAGVGAVACRHCAEDLGVDDDLRSLGVEVRFTGELLTDWLKSDGRVLSV